MLSFSFNAPRPLLCVTLELDTLVRACARFFLEKHLNKAVAIFLEVAYNFSFIIRVYLLLIFVDIFFAFFVYSVDYLYAV